MTNHTTTTTDTYTMTTAPAAPFLPAVVTLGAAYVLGVRWAGRGGVRGSAAWHDTETIVAMTDADDRDGRTLTLTGGAYRDGAPTRTLHTHTKRGKASGQILAAWPAADVVAALAAVMGVPATTAPATPDTDADDDADDAATTDDADGATIVGGATVAAVMVGAVSMGGAESYDRQGRRDHGDARGSARRADARSKRAARRALKRADRRAAIRDAWAMVGAD